MSAEQNRRVRALWLCGVLHAFTHVYHVALMPLYFLIQQDFGLASLGKATLLVTVMMVAYFIPSYPVGVLADRVSRKKLLTLGLLFNALGFIGLALAPNYGFALVSVMVAGIGGSFFHPAATAMVARLYPVGTGRALGYVAIGASIGFVFGPLYSGWRAQHSGWRAPTVELGCLGVIGAIVFWLWADDDSSPEQRRAVAPSSLFPTPALWAFFIVMSLFFSLRDFTGTSMGTLGSLFLQQAHRFSLQSTGFAIGSIFLMAIISNPLIGSLSDRGRIRWGFIILSVAALVVGIFPHLPKTALIPGLMTYGFFLPASYPVIEAALMESVPDAVRGRVFGFFITIGGLVGNVSHWLVGRSVQHLGPAGNTPAGYYHLYAMLALLVFVSLLGLPCLHAIRKREHLDSASMGAPAARPVELVMQNPEV